MHILFYVLLPPCTSPRIIGMSQVDSFSLPQGHNFGHSYSMVEMKEEDLFILGARVLPMMLHRGEVMVTCCSMMWFIVIFLGCTNFNYW